MPTSPVLALPTPTDGSPVDVPGDLQAIVDVLDSKGIPRFTTTGNRNSAMSGLGGAVAGMVAYTAGVLSLCTVGGGNGTWRPISIDEHVGTYTPALTAMSVGTTDAINTATYRFANGVLTVQGRFVWGSAGTRTYPTGSTTFGLPPGFTAEFLSPTDHEVGTWNPRNTGGATPTNGLVWLTSTTTLRPLVRNSGNPYEVASSPTATVPFTWAPGAAATWQATVVGSF